MKLFFRMAMAFSLILAGLATSFRPGLADTQTIAMDWSDLQMVQQINPTAWLTTPGEYFGGAHVTAASGDLMVISDHTRSAGELKFAGAAFIYAREGNRWVQKTALEPVSGVDNGGDFGQAVAISGSRIAISSPDFNDQDHWTPKVFIYTWDGAQLSLEDTIVSPNTTQTHDYFGQTLALKGNTLLVGAEEEDHDSVQDAGAVYVFTRGGDAKWSQKARLTASNPQQQDLFGIEIALDDDGNTAFIRSGGIIGGSTPAKVFVAKRGASGWQDQIISDILDTSNPQEFCYNQLLAADSSRLAVSCPTKNIGQKEYQGVIYIYEKPAGGWTTPATPSATLYAMDGRPYDSLGTRGLSLRGNILVATAANHVIPFIKGTGGWKQQHRLIPPDPSWTSFGGTNALDGEGSILVSAARENAGLSENTVFVFGNSLVSVDPIRLSATEGGSPVSYSLALRRAPTAPVTVNIASSARVIPDPAQLVFTPSDWNTPQVVQLTIQDDQIAEIRQEVGVSHGLASSDPLFNQGFAPTVNVDLIDNDFPGVTQVSPDSPLKITYGANAPAQLRLSTQPTGDVVVHLGNGQKNISASPEALTFTPANWHTPQPVTVSLKDTSGLYPSGAVLSFLQTQFDSVDPVYRRFTSGSLPVLKLPHPDATLWMSATYAMLPEGDSVDVQVHLQSNPGTDVAIYPDDWMSLHTTPTSLTFTKDNWHISQTLHIQAVDDHIVYPGDLWKDRKVDFSSDSTNPDFQRVSGQLTPFYVHILQDIDQVGVQVSDMHFSLAEGSSPVSFQVSLTSKPSTEERVYYSVNNGLSEFDYLNFIPGNLAFTAADWDQPQTITVSAPEDTVDHGSGNLLVYQNITTNAATNEYHDLLLEPLNVAYSDNDTYRMSISPSSSNLNEGQSEDVQISLQNQPTCNVTVQFLYDRYGYKNYDPWAVQISPLSLTFTPETWQTPQSIQITALDDGSEPVRTTTLDPAINSCNGYQLGKIPITITESITPGITAVLPAEEPIDLNEGASLPLKWRLNTRPLANVTIDLIEEGPITFTPKQIVFQPDDWNVEQQVMVNFPEDQKKLSHQNYLVLTKASSSDFTYDQFSIPEIRLNLMDNDSPGVLVTNGPIHMDEDGPATAYQIRLQSQPLFPVTIAIGPGRGLQSNPTTLTFTDQNWDQPQAVSVSAHDNGIYEGKREIPIHHTVTSNDGNYDGITVPDVIVTVSDQARVYLPLIIR